MPEYAHSRHADESEGFFCRFTFGQFFALLVLEVFTIFFVFYLGARYGRGLLGLDEQRPEGAAEVVGQPIAGAEAPRVATTADPEVAKMAEDLIAKAETPELKDRIRRMIDEAQQEDRRQQMPEVISVNRAPEEAPAAAPEPAAAAQEAPPAAGLPPSAEAPQPTAAPEAAVAPEEQKPAAEPGFVRVKTGGGRYAVQVGSYSQRAEAAQMLERWKGKGYSAYLTPADIPGRGRWYRVRIGGFGSRDEAARYLKELSARENVDALVVLNDQ